MKCKECGASDREGPTQGIVLECAACAMFLSDCQCSRKLDYLPKRWVHCRSCDRDFICQVDTKKSGWRSGEV